jgi:hypothetical protein
MRIEELTKKIEELTKRIEGIELCIRHLYEVIRKNKLAGLAETNERDMTL